MVGYTRKFIGLPPSRKWALLLASYWVGIFKVCVRLLSYQRLHKVVNILSRRQYHTQLSADDLAWAVETIGHKSRTSCLPRALAAHVLMQQRGLSSQLRLGVRMDANHQYDMHAWVEDDGTILVGKLENLSDYVTFNTFWSA